VNLTKGSTSVPTVYIEGQNYSGTTAITATATATTTTGFSNGTGTMSLYPTGFGLSTNTLTTTSFSSPTPVTAELVILNPGSLTTYTWNVGLGPQASAVSIAVTSSTTTVGTISGSPATLSLGGYSTSGISFTPVTAGTTNLTLTQPAGYFTPTGGTYSYQQIAATVTP
jgi:hypothetical protein